MPASRRAWAPQASISISAARPRPSIDMMVARHCCARRNASSAQWKACARHSRARAYRSPPRFVSASMIGAWRWPALRRQRQAVRPSWWCMGEPNRKAIAHRRTGNGSARSPPSSPFRWSPMAISGICTATGGRAPCPAVAMSCWVGPPWPTPSWRHASSIGRRPASCCPRRTGHSVRRCCSPMLSAALTSPTR